LAISVVCRHQLIEDINEINTLGYEAFRQYCHQVRIKVESGELIYNSSMGSKRYLNVDKDKEIKIHGVIIDGKIRDHFYESKLPRHEEKLSSEIKVGS
jgi:D-ribose pyranose/furanose isomerase RbsD